jgi:HEAT repeat protein
MSETIPRILGKLDVARRRRLSCFGSDAHRFRLNPRLSDEQIAEFEQAHGILLPEDYRLFLTCAGNGGAGPFYGLLPPERWNDAGNDEVPGALARSSPLRPDIPKENDWSAALGCTWEEMFQGTITLAHEGCTYYALLVVTGNYRGRVVYVDLGGSGSPYFMRDAGFLAWYERWLDELLWGYDIEWFGFGLPGREEDMVAVLRSPDTCASLGQDALRTLARIPKPRPQTLEVVRAALTDTSPDVRREAAYLLGKRRAEVAAGDLMAILTDPVGKVREAALHALGALKKFDWKPAARAALHDDDREVAFRALCLLEEAHALRRADIEPLLQSPDPRRRGSAAWAANSLPAGETDDLPEILLQDLDEEVRRYGILLVRPRGDRRHVPALLAMLRGGAGPQECELLISTLEKLRERTAVPIFIEMTRHPDGFVRMAAARALGTLGARSGIPALRELLSDASHAERTNEHGMPMCWSDRTVAEEARAALDRLGER